MYTQPVTVHTVTNSHIHSLTEQSMIHPQHSHWTSWSSIV